jgi:transposase
MIQFDFVGVDVSKDKFDAALLFDDKNLHKIFDNSITGFKLFNTWLKKHSQNPWVCMEATGHYSEHLANFLLQKKIRVSVVNPLQIKHFLKAKLTRNKNDKVDALGIGSYCKTMRPNLYQAVSSSQKELRELVQLIEMLKNQLQQLKNQLSSLQSTSAKQAIKIAIKDLEKRIASLEKKVDQKVEQNEHFSSTVELITSIKGLGKWSACALLAYLPDIALFDTPKQLAAFIGVSPRQKQSGKFVGKTCLSKFGNPKLRKILYMPALTLKRCNTALKPFVTRLENKKLKPKAIVGALMRKLVHILFGILKSRQPFNPCLV